MLRPYALLCLLALFSFVTSPAGFMPGTGASGAALLICPGSTDIGRGQFVSPMASGHDGHAMADHHDHHTMASDGKHGPPDADASNPSCDYGTPAQADLAEAPEIAAGRLPFIRTEPPATHPLTTLFPAALPPSTGPPARS